MMAYTSLFAGVFLLDPQVSKPKKVLLGIAIVIMLTAMVYSGTRTAYIMIPAGIFFFALLSGKKWVLIGTGSGLVLGIVFFFIPIENTHIQRLKSAFNPHEIRFLSGSHAESGIYTAICTESSHG